MARSRTHADLRPARRSARGLEDYFGQATAPSNVSLSGHITCDGVGAAGHFGRGSEICSAACSSTSGEEATIGLGAIASEACVSGAGASRPTCSDQFAIISLAALPYDCQPDVAATPRQNAITKRKIVRPRDGGLLDTRARSRSCCADISSDGTAHLRENLDCVGLSLELIDSPLFLI